MRPDRFPAGGSDDGGSTQRRVGTDQDRLQFGTTPSDHDAWFERLRAHYLGASVRKRLTRLNGGAGARLADPTLPTEPAVFPFPDDPTLKPVGRSVVFKRASQPDQPDQPVLVWVYEVSDWLNRHGQDPFFGYDTYHVYWLVADEAITPIPPETASSNPNCTLDRLSPTVLAQLKLKTERLNPESRTADHHHVERLDSRPDSPYMGCGTVLVQAALEHNLRQGYRGRMDVSSTPFSSGFWVKAGWAPYDVNRIPLDMDPAVGLTSHALWQAIHHRDDQRLAELLGDLQCEAERVHATGTASTTGVAKASRPQPVRTTEATLVLFPQQLGDWRRLIRRWPVLYKNP
ncbi:MAG: hypothetical protein KC474_02845 [Cyanobacteria bacterium HKST-UBA04]|nr:hypothetical protein [Cyanobacteria bacterium HKST-UBA04]